MTNLSSKSSQSNPGVIIAVVVGVAVLLVGAVVFVFMGAGFAAYRLTNSRASSPASSASATSSAAAR